MAALRSATRTTSCPGYPWVVNAAWSSEQIRALGEGLDHRGARVDGEVARAASGAEAADFGEIALDGFGVARSNLVGLDEQLSELPARRGWLVLEGAGGDDPLTRVGEALERLRNVGQRPQMPSVVPG